MSRKKIANLITLLLVVLMFTACKETKENASNEVLSIDYVKYELENGLDVILHQDKSDPIVSLAIVYHVGSSREKPGRTGFAHLFEHMLFQQSENVGQDQFFKIVQDAGGTLNGFTFEDGTTYFEIVPKNALEKVLWLESDRMGFFKNTITDAAFANQQDVVINEKRQRVDNQPYGHTNYVIRKAIYPADHPYNWQVIGEMEDLSNATLEDVRAFYDDFYGPNNATLSLTGDFEIEEAKQLIEKYFGEIKKGREVSELQKPAVSMSASKNIYHEDNFASTPQFNMVWPAVEQFHPDSYALNALAKILSDGKTTPLYKVLVKDKELTSNTVAYLDEMELSGLFRIYITAHDGVDLDSVYSGVNEAFERFEKEGISDSDLERVKASLERDYYNQMQSVFYKGFLLAYYHTFAGDASFGQKYIQNVRSVTKEDVMRVYETYLKGKPYVATSFVPKGQMDLIIDGSEKAKVVEEDITEDKTRAVADAEEAEIEKTPSAIDRSKQPELGDAPVLKLPEVWTSELKNGVEVYGIENNELPLVQVAIVLDGGHLLDDPEKVGVANLMTDIMMEGTATKTPEELEKEIKLLGSDIGMYTSDESIVVYANTLSRNFDKTMKLVEEILMEPRWDTTEFARIKTKTINDIKHRKASPDNVSDEVFKKLVYGDEHILGTPAIGTEESVASIDVGACKDFYEKYYSPKNARVHVVGKISKEKVLNSLASLSEKWQGEKVVIPEYPLPEKPTSPVLYFVDFPDAKQSVINIGYLALPRSHPDFYPAEVMNYMLGGSFSGRVNLILREEKGYTYGARTYFSGGILPGPFAASSSVRTNVTLESVNIFREEMNKYREGISEEDMAFTKNALINSNARRFETLGAKLGILTTMSKYDFSPDYILKEQEVIQNMTVDRQKELAQKYIIPEQMIYVVVGDAKTQLSRFADAGFSEIVLLDKSGNRVEQTPSLASSK